VIKTGDYIYVFGFKMGLAQAALDQIKNITRHIFRTKEPLLWLDSVLIKQKKT
jgi:hypothetical protein